MKHLVTRENAVRALHAADPGWSLPQWAIGAAWFLVFVSVIQLGAGLLAGSGDGSALSATFAGLQLAAVGGGFTFTLLPIRKLRRLGHVILVVWAGLCLAGFLRVTMADPGLLGVVQTAVVGLLFGATCYRAKCGWNSGPGFRAQRKIARVAKDEHQSVNPAGIQEEDLDTVLSGSVEQLSELPTSPATAKQPPAARKAREAWKRSVCLAKSGTRHACSKGSAFLRTNWPRIRDGFRKSDRTAPAAQQV